MTSSKNILQTYQPYANIKPSVFLNILAGKKQPRPAVWLMRQAGRSLKAYMELKKKYHFHEIMRTPELATEVTLQPVDYHGVDAAIIFSDILVVIEALGIPVDYTGNKPCITTPLKNDAKLLQRIIAGNFLNDDLGKRNNFREEFFMQTARAIKLVKQRSNVPLIGFCGGPLTVLCYLFDGMGGDFPATRKFFYTNPEEANLLLHLISEVSLRYAKTQIDAGANAFQIFETWATAIPANLYFRVVFPHVASMANQLKKYSPTPLIYFPKGMGASLSAIPKDMFSAVSIDHFTPLGNAKLALGNTTLQGNIDPYLPLALSGTALKKAMQEQLKFFTTHNNWIVNLGHGVLPLTPQENIRTLVECVKNYGK